MIKEPQVGATNVNIDQLVRSYPLRISIVEDPISYFDRRSHVLKNALKNYMCLFEGKRKHCNSSLIV